MDAGAAKTNKSTIQNDCSWLWAGAQTQRKKKAATVRNKFYGIPLGIVDTHSHSHSRMYAQQINSEFNGKILKRCWLEKRCKKNE